MEETKKEEHHPTHEVKHEIHHEEHHTPVHHKKTNYWMYAAIVLIVILAVSVYFNWTGTSSGGLSTEETGTKIMTFINGNLMQPGTEAELKNIEEANGVYIVDLTVAGQEFKSYVSKDGEIFFPQGYVLKELEAELAATKTGTEEATAAPVAAVKSDKPNVKMFVMSFCPYGQQAENGLGPALEALGDKVEFEPHFVIYSNYAKNKGADWQEFCFDEAEQYCSMHGIGELNEGIRQLCVFSETPAKFWDYVNAINSKCSYQNIETCWEGVAKEVGLDTAAIKKCFDDKGELFLKKEVLLNKQFSVQGSPTVLINDAAFNGGRAPEDYKQGICDAFNKAPAACEEALSTTGAAASGGCAS